MDYRLVHVGSPVDLAHLQAGGWVGGGTAWSMWAHLCVLVGRGVELGACLGTLLLARLNSHASPFIISHFPLHLPPRPSVHTRPHHHPFTLSLHTVPSSLSSHPATSPSGRASPRSASCPCLCSHFPFTLCPQFTPGRITIWEGFTTLGFMPVFVYTTWLVDTRGFNWFGPNKNVGCSGIYGSGFGGSGFTRDFQRFERNTDVG